MMPETVLTIESFLNQRPELKSGKIEILAAFEHYMVNVKNIVTDTENNFLKAFEDFKSATV